MAIEATIAALVVASLRIAEPPPPQVPPPEAAPAEHEALAPRPEPPPWQKDPAAGAFAGVGSVAIALGVGLVVGAHTLRADAPNTSNEREFEARVTTTRGMNIAGWSTLAIGCTLLVAAALRWGLLAREQRARRGGGRRR
jgi:hypothetical protein